MKRGKYKFGVVVLGNGSVRGLDTLSGATPIKFGRRLAVKFYVSKLGSIVDSRPIHFDNTHRGLSLPSSKVKKLHGFRFIGRNEYDSGNFCS